MGAPEKFYRLPDVLKLLGIKKTTWWQGIRDGRFPKGHILGKRSRIWTDVEIKELMQSVAEDKSEG